MRTLNGNRWWTLLDRVKAVLREGRTKRARRWARLLRRMAPNEQAQRVCDILIEASLEMEDEFRLVDGDVFHVWWLESNRRPGLPEHFSDRKSKRVHKRPPVHSDPSRPRWRWDEG